MKRLYERNQYSFKLDWAFCRLEPGDLVTLTESTCGLHKQIVVITDVQEAQDGELQITAIGKPAGVYAPTKYDVHENERPFVDYNKPAQSILDATFIQPPADVMGKGQELWVGVSTPQEWGGCEVWMSDDPTANFQSMGMINTTVRIGKLVSPLSANGNSCIVRMVNGMLKSGTHIDAERGNTVCYINGECLSYETATLNADGTITLNNLVRGQFNTPIGSHSTGDKLSRLDEAFMRIPYRKQDVGKKIYAKFTSLNNLGGQQEDISRVKQYEYTIQEYFIPEVSEFTLSNKYRQLGGKAIAYDLVAKFIPPNLKTLSTVVAWYREQGISEWIYGGDGNGQIVISQCEVGKTYDVKLQVKDINGNYSEGIVKSLQIALKSDKPNTPDGFTIRFAEQAIYNWREVTNADVDFYEVRLNTAIGNDDGLLAKSSNTTASSLLQNRQGTVYLYAHNPVKGYSAPAMLEYNVPKPITPTDVTVKTTMNGLVVTYSPIPSGSHHANIYVNTQRYQSTSNTIFIPIEAGVHKVKVAYVDIFGEGDSSGEQLATVKAEIPPELLKGQNDAIANIDARTKELDKTVQAIDNKVVQTVSNQVTGMSSRITALDNLINQTVRDVNNNVNSQITQVKNSIDLKVTQGLKSLNGQEIISRINLSPEGTRIDGKLLHVTGKAKFDDNIITSKMLQASAVTADKIKVDSLSSITANVGTLTGGTIVGTTIQNANGTFSVSPDGNIKGATIDAQSFKRSGFEIHAMKTELYSVADGAPLPCPTGYKVDDCFYVIMNAKNFTGIKVKSGPWGIAVYDDKKKATEFDRNWKNVSDLKQVSPISGTTKTHHEARRIRDDDYERAYDSFEDIVVGIDRNNIVVAKKRWRNDSDHIIENRKMGVVDILCIATKR